MLKIRQRLFALFILLVVLSVANTAYAKKLYPLAPNTFYKVRVERVVDGDTTIVRFEGDERERVRFIGANTPESVKPNSPVEYYGKEASDFTKKELTGKTLFIQTDVEVRDRYKRALAYVWMEKPKDAASKAEIRAKMFNARLLLDGFGQTMTIQPNSKHSKLFAAFEREAREKKKGLWGGN